MESRNKARRRRGSKKVWLNHCTTMVQKRCKVEKWTHTDKIEILKDIESFSEANSETLDVLADCFIARQYKRGEHVFKDKEECSSLYIVKSGLVSLYKISSQGEKKVIFILGKGKVINEVVLQGLPSSISCDAFEPSEILCWNKDKFLQIMSQDFGLTKGVMRSLSLKTRRLYRQLKNTSNSVRGDKRIAAKLWKLSGDYGIACEKGIYIDMELSITYLADMLGSQRETVSRQIKILKEHGLIGLEDKKFIVYNRDKLANYFKEL